ncbi:MAG: hydrogenase maturation protease [Nodosilinea sp.]
MDAMTSTTRTTNPYSLLIVGYGNERRGDEGVGRQVAATVAGWHLPAVKSLAAQQLLPEIAAEVAKASYVIFVDACGRCASSIQLVPIVADKQVLALCTASSLDHVCEPRELVALTHVLYGNHPQAWLLQIPTEHHDLGRSFSKTAQRGVDSALRTIEQVFTTYLRRPALTCSNLRVESA